MQAGLATLKNLDAQTYKGLNTICDDFVVKTNAQFKNSQWPTLIWSTIKA